MQPHLSWSASRNLATRSEITYSILRYLRVQPFWQHVGSFNKQKLAIGIVKTKPCVVKFTAKFAKEVDDEPFIVYGITVVCPSGQKPSIYILVSQWRSSK